MKTTAVISSMLNQDNSYQRSNYNSPNNKDNISSYNKDKLLSNLKETLYDNKHIEKQRSLLACNQEFTLLELYQMIDTRKNGCLNQYELQDFVYKNDLKLESFEIKMLITRYDKDKDGVLSFSEFSKILIPENQMHKSELMSRLEVNVGSFCCYSESTQIAIRNLFKSIVMATSNFESNLNMITGGDVGTSKEIFRYIDKYGDGFLTVKELEDTFADNGIKVSKQEVRNLFDQFDKNADERITFEEFYCPARRRHQDYH